MVEVIKRQPNVGEFVLTVTPLSYDEFDSMGLQLPIDLPIGDRPDAAERKSKLMTKVTLLTTPKTPSCR